MIFETEQLCSLCPCLQNHACYAGIMLDAFAYTYVPIMLKIYSSLQVTLVTGSSSKIIILSNITVTNNTSCVVQNFTLDHLTGHRV